MNISIEKIYKQLIEKLAKLLNLNYEDAERFYVAGMRELLKQSMTQFDNVPDCFSVLVNKARKGDEQSRKELLKVFSKEEVEKLISINLEENK